MKVGKLKAILENVDNELDVIAELYQSQPSTIIGAEIGFTDYEDICCSENEDDDSNLKEVFLIRVS